MNPGIQAAMVAAAVRDYGVTAQQALHDVDVQTTAGDVVGQLEQALGSGFAGVWFDNVAGKFNIDVAPSTSQSAVQNAEASLGITAESNLVPVKYTWNQLTATENQLTSTVAALPAADGATLAISAPGNAVAISLAPSAPAADREQVTAQVQAAASASGPPVNVVTSPVAVPTQPQDALCNGAYCNAPLRGGIAIGQDGPTSNPNNYSCTAGYVVYSPNPIAGGGYLYILTAGHCLGDTSSWWTFQADRKTFRWIGPPESWFDDSRGDAAMIAITGPYFCQAFGGRCSGTNVAAYNAEFDVNDVLGYADFPIYGDGSSYYGLEVCHVGASSGFQCGFDSDPYLVNGYFTENGIGTVGHGTYNDGCSTGGDSGGPWLAGNTAYGLEATGNGCLAAGSVYTEVSADLARWGLTGADL